MTPIERNKVNMPEDESVSAAAVSLKLAEFFPHNAAFWFILAEQQFHIKGISKDETMYAHVVSSLKEDVSVRVMSLLLNPPATGKYDALKQLLLQAFTPSKAEAAAMLFDYPGLGDRKPTQMLQHMMTLLPAKERVEPGIMFCEAFMRQLPSDVRAHLTDKGDLPLSELAAEADKFFTNQGLRIAAVQSAVPAQFQRPRPNQRAPTAPVRAPAARIQPAENGYCYYHNRYGGEARRCRRPCTFNQEN